MAVDPTTGHPARISYAIKADGSKERVFKVSPNHNKLAKADKPDKSASTDTTDKGKKE
jgi:hypothetical protein